MTCYLYRHYSASGELLYVGISLSAVARLNQHRQSEWFGEIAKVEIERLLTREYAQFVEALEIHHFKPKHNKLQPFFDLWCPKMTAIAIEEARSELWAKAFDPSVDAEFLDGALHDCALAERENLIEIGIREARRQKEKAK